MLLKERLINTMFEINNGHGDMVRSFQEKAEAGGKFFFESMFKEPKGFPILEILEVLRLFPRMIT